MTASSKISAKETGKKDEAQEFLVRSARAYWTWSKKEIESAFKSAQRVHSSPELLVLATVAQKTFGRILVVTPKKSGSAPERNLFKRRVRAIFYEAAIYEKHPHTDWLVIARNDMKNICFCDLKNLLLKTFSKA